MSSPEYVHEKMLVAVNCLCGEGPLHKRLANATVSALARPTDDDLGGELGADLKYILDWTSRNIENGIIQKEPDELERNTLTTKMLKVLLETNSKIKEKPRWLTQP